MAFVAAAFVACAHGDSTAQPASQKPAVQPPPNEARAQSPADAQALAEFNQRLEQYADLHRRLEGTLPKLPKESDPKTIDAHQRALEKLIKAERKTAKPGDIFTPGIQAHIRQLLTRVFAGKDGAQLKATILDENPGKIALTVNSRYPDEVPLSTVPPQVLASLPKLPEDLEYRFIGDRLILLDLHAHTIADYMDNVFPG
jgi:hypothetical protein